MKTNDITIRKIENFAKIGGLENGSKTYAKFAQSALDLALSGVLDDGKEYDEVHLLRAILFCASNDINLCNKEAYLLPFAIKKDGKPTGKHSVIIQVDYKHLRQLILKDFPTDNFKLVEIELKEGDIVNQIFDISDDNFGWEIIKFNETDQSKRRKLNTFAYYAAVISIKDKRIVGSYVAYCESVRSTINEMKALSQEAKSKYEPKFQNGNVHFAKFALRKLADRLPKGDKLRTTINAEDFNFIENKSNDKDEIYAENINVEIINDKPINNYIPSERDDKIADAIIGNTEKGGINNDVSENIEF